MQDVVARLIKFYGLSADDAQDMAYEEAEFIEEMMELRCTPSQIAKSLVNLYMVA